MDHKHFENQIDTYFENCLDIIEQYRLEQHCKNCPECSERLMDRFLERTDGERGLLGAFENKVSTGECLHYSTIEEYVEGKLTEEEVILVNQHLESCFECFLMVEEYWQYLQRGKMIWLYPQSLSEVPEIPILESEYYGGQEAKQLAARSAFEEFDGEGILSVQDEFGTTQARVYLDEEDDLRVMLVEYARSLQGQKAVISIPELQRVSETETLTGEPVEFNLGTIDLTGTGLPEIHIKLISKEGEVV